MPSLFRKRRAAKALSNGRSSSTAVSNDSATHIKNNKTNKRKKLTTKPTQALDSKANREIGNDATDNRRQLDTYAHGDDSEPLYISSTLLELSEGERSRLLRYIDDAGINSKCQHLLDQQDSYQGGHGQEINTEVDGIAHSGLVTYYEGLGDSGLATLQKDIATCRLQISNTDSDTDEDESLAADNEDGINYTTQNVEDDIRFDSGGDEGGLGELRTDIPVDGAPKIDRAPNGVEDGNQSSVAAVGEEDVERDDEGFSIDIGSNESINGGTTPIDASHTNTSPTTDEDNAPPTTSTLKLDSSCIGHGVEETRKDYGPSPTNATANLSRCSSIL